MKGAAKLAAGLVAGILVGLVVSAAAQESPRPADGPARGKGGGFAFRVHGKPMRTESVFHADDGTITTMRMDHGLVQSVDGSTIVVKEDDGTVVQVPTDSGTRFSRDDSDATLADIKAGDHVMTAREKAGDAAFSTKDVHAISPERYQEMEQRRAQCEQDPNQCPRPGFHEHRGPGGPGVSWSSAA
jgi:hypothetical protein